MNNNQQNNSVTGNNMNSNQLNNQPISNNLNINPIPDNQNSLQSQPQVQFTNAASLQNYTESLPNVGNEVNQKMNLNNVSKNSPSEPTSNVITNIPTVEQGSDSFVQNVQTISSEKKVENKKGINYSLIIILFIIVLLAIFFLFPILKNYI